MQSRKWIVLFHRETWLPGYDGRWLWHVCSALPTQAHPEEIVHTPDFAPHNAGRFHCIHAAPSVAAALRITSYNVCYTKLLRADNISSSKEYLLKGQDYYYRNRSGDLGSKIKVAIYLSFENTKQENLGLPLPKGIVRVYKQDSSGAVQFVGEDRIDHTPENETRNNVV